MQQYHIGHTIRDYTIEALIGRGGFAEVYRARHRQIGREVAIKVILPQHASNEKFMIRFQREARFIAANEHPNIVKLYDFWHTDHEGAFMIMQWLDSGSLKQRLSTRSLSVNELVRLVREVGGALQHTHTNGVVHRDMKPDNILYDRHDNAYLTDFGVAKDIMDLSAPTLTVEGSAIGTPAYIAPEQIVGDPVTARTDIYALGLLMYESMVGVHPFDEDDLTIATLINKHISTPVPDIDLGDSVSSNHINTIIQRATAKEPSARYDNMNALILDVEELLTIVPAAQLETPLVIRKPAQNKAFVTGSMTQVSASARKTNTSLGRSRPMGDLKAAVYHEPSAVLKRPRRLIGRDDMKARLHNAIEHGEQASVYGYGGIGKTSVVATVVAEHIQNTGQPVVWLEFGYSEAVTVFEAIAAAFDERDTISRLSGDEQISALRSLLAKQQLPLVLDDVWNEKALFQVLKAIPFDLPLLITSRNALPIEGDLLDIGVLPTEFALELLAYHSRRNLDGDDDAKTLCEMVGNHTFAVELAGKHLKIDTELSIPDLISRLKNSVHRLEAPNSFGDVGRRGVDDLIGESYAALDANSQRLLAAMGGMHELGTSSALLAKLVEQPIEQVENCMIELGKRGLVSMERNEQYTIGHIHALTYSFAKQLFRASTLYAKVDHALLMFTAAHVKDFDLLEAEQPNILGLLKRPSTAVTTKVDIMQRLIKDGYLANRGHTKPFVELMDDVINLVKDQQSLHVLLSKRGNVAYHRGDYTKALENYKKALRIAVDEGMGDREVIMQCGIAKIRVEQNADDADTYLDAAQAKADELDDDFLRGWVLETRGYAAQHRNDYKNAVRYFGEGVELCRRVNDEEGLYFALLNLGTAYTKLEQTSKAESTLDEAFELAQRLDQKAAMAHVLESLGGLRFASGNIAKAFDNYSQALQIFQEIGQEKAAERVEQLISESFTQQSS